MKEEKERKWLDKGYRYLTAFVLILHLCLQGTEINTPIISKKARDIELAEVAMILLTFSALLSLPIDKLALAIGKVIIKNPLKGEDEAD
jgi:hypothetical protein